MIFVLAGLAAALQAPAAAPAPAPSFYNHVPPKEMRAAIEACGFKQVWVGKDKRKRSVVRVSDTAATDEQLICAATVIDKTFYTEDFAAPLPERFAQIRAMVARPRQLAEARARFARSPEMGPPPERSPNETTAALAKRVETFCGADAEGAFVQEAGAILISGDWIQQRSVTADDMVEMASTMGCLMQAAVIADLPIGPPAG